MTWDDIRHFKPSEFASPDKRDSGYMMSLDFVRKLDKLRDAVNRPLFITSGYRTPQHNEDIHGEENSAHLTGHAADIQTLTSPERYSLLECALRLGFRRIGIGSNFIHIDDSINHDQDVCWTYPPKVKR